MSTSASQPSEPTPNPFRAPPAESKGKFVGILTPASEFDSSFTDSSSTLFSLYLSHAEKYDKFQVEIWKAGADGILVFTGLFAAALATFVVDSYKSLLPDSAGNAVVILAQISQQLDGLSNGTHVPIASLSPPSGARQSSPPASAVWVNSLWFLSLVISLFCALLATLQQRWARRYLGMTQPHVAIHKRAHIRSFFAEGVSRFNLHVAIEALPTLLHISVFLFLAGLVISLFTIHHTVAYITLSATVVCFLFYAAITVMPMVYHDSPYTSPLSTLIWYISRKVAVAVLNAFDSVVDHLRKYKETFTRFVARSRSVTKTESSSPPSPPRKVSSDEPPLSESISITEAIYRSAMRPDSERDARALAWTLDRLDEEGELVQFAAGIPGLSHSTKVEESVSILEMAPMSSELHPDLSLDIANLLMRAFKPGQVRDSKLLPESVRKQRVAICLEALYYLPDGLKTLLQYIASNLDHPRVTVGLLPALLSVESWLFAERLSKARISILDRAVKIGAQCMAAVIASQPPPDEQSRSILMRHLGIDELLLNHYLEPFDSLLLKNLNYFLMTTAEDVINDENIQHHIDLVLLTVRMAKRLKFEHAAQELREQFERLRTRIQQYEYAAESSKKTRDNAVRLLSELSSLTTNPPLPHPGPQLDPARDPRAHTWPTDAPGTVAASMSAHSPQTSQNSSGRGFLHPISQPSNDAYISMVASSPVPQNDTFTMAPLSPSINSGSG